jgi:hypothetical protein
MSGELLPPQQGLSELRERTVHQLCAHFAADTLDADELERRLDRVYAAASRAELSTLVSDLPELGQDRTEAPYTLARAEEVPRRQLVLAVMGGSERKGAWTPPRHMFAVACMGGVCLDYREARFPPGVTEITAVALMGGLEVIVPPWVRVETNGLAVLGAFEHGGEGDSRADAGAPVLRIGGLASLGAVEVSVRLPGERASDTRRRLKEAQREQASRRRLRG